MLDTEIHIDLTTIDSEFNSLSNQGQWLYHRFGKRNIPDYHLNISTLKNFLYSNKLQTIVLTGIFGDPLSYKDFDNLINFCNQNKINVVCTTHGMNDKVVEYSDKLSYYFQIHGFNDSLGKVYKNDFKAIENIKKCKGNHFLEFSLYDHNLYDVPALIDFCEENNINLKLKKGIKQYDDIGHIINKNGEWQFDIFMTQYCKYTDEYLDKNQYDVVKEYYSKFKKIETFSKSVYGYHLLKNYVKAYQNFNDEKSTYTEKLKQDSRGLILGFTGHVFYNLEMYNIFANSLVNDWQRENFDLSNPYDKSVYDTVYFFKSVDLDEIHYSNDLLSINNSSVFKQF